MKRSLAIFEKVQGPEHLDVATSLHNLASLVQKQVCVGEVEGLCCLEVFFLQWLEVTRASDPPRSLGSWAFVLFVIDSNRNPQLNG